MSDSVGIASGEAIASSTTIALLSHQSSTKSLADAQQCIKWLIELVFGVPNKSASLFARMISQSKLPKAGRRPLLRFQFRAVDMYACLSRLDQHRLAVDETDDAAAWVESMISALDLTAATTIAFVDDLSIVQSSSMPLFLKQQLVAIDPASQCCCIVEVSYGSLVRRDGEEAEMAYQSFTATYAIPHAPPPSSIVCSVCRVAVEAPLRCGRCHSVVYCSRTCQKSGWQAGHKLTCK
jgi:hypothetical protein